MIDALIKGLVLGILLSISVGPVIFTIIKQSINNGLRGGFLFIAGVSVSDITLVLLSNVFTELFRALLELKKPIGIVGSLFLLGLGIFFMFFKKVKVGEGGMQVTELRKRDYAQIFLAGFFINALNPAVIAFWFTWATAFVAHKLGDRIVLFSSCLTLVLAADIAKVLLAEKLRKYLTPKVIGRINKVSGTILISFGLLLLYELVFKN